MIVIFAGCIGRFPLAGHAWIDIQYLLGLRDLGCDVFYLEDCGKESWVYNWQSYEVTSEFDYPSSYIQQSLEAAGLDINWLYRAGDHSRGMALEAFQDICSRADLMIIRGVTIPEWREEYNLPRSRIYIDVDPGFTQIRLATMDAELAGTIDHCQTLFTIAQRLGADDCSIPTAGHNWFATLSPVSLRHWPFAESMPATYFTSILQWRSYKEVIYDGISYGNKDREFPKFIGLPRLTKQQFQIALTGESPKRFTKHGWGYTPGWIVSEDLDSYRNFIQRSRAEFGVAKHGYVATLGGWFSDRSVCYLASGRPILIQDTGLSDWLPIGEGVVVFRDLREALNGIEALNSDYERHRKAARSLAEQYFSTDIVIPSLLEVAIS